MSVPEIQLEQIIDYVGQEDDRMMAFYAVPARFSAPDTFGPEFLIATSSGTINYVGFGPATTACVYFCVSFIIVFFDSIVRTAGLRFASLWAN
jgi:hypothetical protein